MGAFDPIETPAKKRPKAKSGGETSARETLAEKMKGYIGCVPSDALPPDAARRHKAYFHAGLVKKRTG
jgi:hypothetical protein